MRPSRILLAVAALAGLASCSYTFNNPVEQLGPGEVGGRLVSGSAAVGGAAISVKGVGLDARSRASGRFAVLPLPVGRHTLVFRKGTDRALQRVVDVALGKDGQPQGVWLGDVELPAAVALQGEVALPGGAALGDNGLVVDETSGATAPVKLAADLRSGTFLITGLAVGTHRLRVAASDAGGTAHVAGPVDVTFSRSDAGSVKTMARTILRRPVAAPSPVTLRLGIVGSVPGLSLADLVVNGLGQPVIIGADGHAQVRVAEGPWTVTVTLPGSLSGVSAPPPVSFVAVSGATIDLGTLYAISDAAAQQASLACHTDPDCAPSGTCSGGQCQGWTPPPAAPASVPFCAGAGQSCAPGAPIGTTQPYTQTCVLVGATGSGAAVTCGTCCTPDGVNVACALPGEGGCPAPPAVTYSVSGRVSGDVSGGVQILAYGQGGPGGERFATTDASGSYTLTGLAAGSWDVSPSLLDYSFTPASRQVTITSANVTGVDFVASSQGGGTGSISGTITGAPGRVLVTLSGGGGYIQQITASDAGGTYRFDDLSTGSYVVTPDLTGVAFSPMDATVSVTGPTQVDFTATAAGSLTGVCTPGGLCWLNPLPFGELPLSVWSASPTDVWVGSQQRLFRWNGASWAEHLGAPGVSNQVRGSAPDDVWAVGNGESSHYDGIAWTPVLVPDGAHLNDVWALSSTAAVAVGTNGDALRWDGSNWLTTSTGIASDLEGVFGFTQDDVWAVGGDGVILHWDGAVWTSMTSGTTFPLHGVWGAAPDDLWVTGAYGTMLHWNGGTWTSVPTGSLEYLYRLWGSSSTDVWAVGTGGTVLRWDGVSWGSSITGSLQTFLIGISGSSASDVWACGFSGLGGQGLLHWDGTDWRAVTSGTRSDFTAVWGSGTTDVIALRYEAAPPMATYQRWNGSAWSAGIVGPFYPRAIWGSGPTDAWAVGSLGAVAHWDGAVWTTVASPAEADLYAVGGSGPNDVWAVGDLATIVHWDGAAWTTVESGLAFPGYLRGVWSAGPNDAYAVGADDGYAGAILHWNGLGWSPMSIDTTAPLGAVWGSGPGDVWAAGAGEMLQLSGSVWAPVTTPGALITGVSGSAPTMVFAVDSSGQFLSYDGFSWQVTGTNLWPLTGVWADPSGVWAVGHSGTILGSFP